MRSPERVVVVALGVLGALLVLLAASRVWLSVTVADPLTGSGRLHPSGRSVAPLVPAAALVGLAAAVAAVTMRRVGRWVAGLLLVVAAGAVGAAAVSVLAHPRSSAGEAIRQATGRTGTVSATAHASGWPYLALVGAALVAVAGALTVVRGRGWGGLSTRYDAPTAEPAGPTDHGEDPWDALSRGEDPTRPEA